MTKLFDIFPFNDTENSSYFNIYFNAEVHKWHSEDTKLNVNIFHNTYENNFSLIILTEAVVFLYCKYDMRLSYRLMEHNGHVVRMSVCGYRG